MPATAILRTAILRTGTVKVAVPTAAMLAAPIAAANDDVSVPSLENDCIEAELTSEIVPGD
jgi:hypothetical protein